MQSYQEQWDDRRHTLIVRAIREASESLMERYNIFFWFWLTKYPLILRFRTRTTTESNYWKNTNNVRRNLLMAAVKTRIWNEWNPAQENYESLDELRSLSFRRLVAAVVSSVSKSSQRYVN
jgi:hypothetical protein